MNKRGLLVEEARSFSKDLLFGRRGRLDINGAIQLVADKYKLSKNPDDYVYIVVTALHANVPNDNGDCFSLEELERFDEKLGCRVYETFIGKPHFIEHMQNGEVYGFVLDSHLEKPKNGEPYVELVVAVDTKKNPIYGMLVKNGKIKTYSMGCTVSSTICSICGNRAFTESQFCDHIKNGKMQKFKIAETGEEGLSFEYCEGVVFDEISGVSDPADRGAVLEEKLGSKKAQTPIGPSGPLNPSAPLAAPEKGWVKNLALDIEKGKVTDPSATVDWFKQRYNREPTADERDRMRYLFSRRRIEEWRRVMSKIVKKEDGYYVESAEGKNLGGPYEQKSEAEKRLKEVEMFKHMKGRKIRHGLRLLSRMGNDAPYYKWYFGMRKLGYNSSQIEEIAKEGQKLGYWKIMDEGEGVGGRLEKALMRAIWRNDVESVERLLNKGADVHAGNDRILRFGLEKGDPQIVALLKAYASRNRRGYGDRVEGRLRRGLRFSDSKSTGAVDRVRRSKLKRDLLRRHAFRRSGGGDDMSARHLVNWDYGVKGRLGRSFRNGVKELDRSIGLVRRPSYRNIGKYGFGKYRSIIEDGMSDKSPGTFVPRSKRVTDSGILDKDYNLRKIDREVTDEALSDKKSRRRGLRISKYAYLDVQKLVDSVYNFYRKYEKMSRKQAVRAIGKLFMKRRGFGRTAEDAIEMNIDKIDVPGLMEEVVNFKVSDEGLSPKDVAEEIIETFVEKDAPKEVIKEIKEEVQEIAEGVIEEDKEKLEDGEVLEEKVRDVEKEVEDLKEEAPAPSADEMGMEEIEVAVAKKAKEEIRLYGHKMKRALRLASVRQFLNLDPRGLYRIKTELCEGLVNPSGVKHIGMRPEVAVQVIEQAFRKVLSSNAIDELIESAESLVNLEDKAFAQIEEDVSGLMPLSIDRVSSVEVDKEKGKRAMVMAKTGSGIFGESEFKQLIKDSLPSFGIETK